MSVVSYFQCSIFKLHDDIRHVPSNVTAILIHITICNEKHKTLLSEFRVSLEINGTDSYTCGKLFEETQIVSLTRSG